jgi:hypothetical protein
MVDSTNVALLPEVREILDGVAVVQTYARDLVVATESDYSQAAERLKSVKAAQKRLEDKRTAITRPMQTSLKAVLDLFRTPGDTLKQAEDTIKSKLNGYTAEQERIRREQQAKLDAEAKAERDRLQRLADEAAAKARAEEKRLRDEAEEAAAAGRAEEAAKLEAKAAKVVEKADVKAAQLQDRAAATVAPVIASNRPVVAGISSRQVWKHRVTQPSLVPDEYKLIDDAKLGAYGRAMKQDAKVPGVEFYPEDVMAAGRR